LAASDKKTANKKFKFTMFIIIIEMRLKGMHKKTLISIILIIILTTGAAFSGCASEYKSVEISEDRAYEALIQQIPDDLNISFAQTMSAYVESELGFALSGSQSATQTADLISSKMSQLGLSGVAKEEFSCSSFSFRSAQLSYRTEQGEVVSFRLSALPSDSSGEQRLTLISVGNGSADEYEDVTVKGKAVLAILDNQDDNTIKYVIEQARAHGAAALITAFTNSEEDEQLATAYFSDTYSVTSSMAVLNMTETDAQVLLGAYEDAVENESAVVVTLNTDFGFTDNSTGYNVVGYIPGLDENSRIIITADYDRFYYGYNENCCSVALLLGLAQAVKNSGYTPQKTLVFVAYGGSEFAKRNTDYSTSYGAYIQLTQTHAEWTSGNTVHIDITMPAADHGTSYPLAVSVGLETFVSNTLSDLTGTFENGVTISNNIIGGESGYIFESIGIPTVGLDLDVSEFAVNFRHTNLDNTNRYDAEIFRYSYELYAKLLLAFDQTAVIPYNFLPFFTNLNQDVDETALLEFGIDITEMENAEYVATVQAQIMNYYVRNINTAYEDAVAAGEYNKAGRIYSSAFELNAEMRKFFMRIDSTFFVLNSRNRKQSSYEIPLDYASKMETALVQFEQGKVSTCIETCQTIGELKYTFLFDASVCNSIAGVINNGSKKTLYWADAQFYTIPDIYDTLRDLYLKRNASFTSTDFIEELDSLDEFYDTQTENVVSAFESRAVSCRLFAGEVKKLTPAFEKFEGYFD